MENWEKGYLREEAVVVEPLLGNGDFGHRRYEEETSPPKGSLNQNLCESHAQRPSQTGERNVG